MTCFKLLAPSLKTCICPFTPAPVPGTTGLFVIADVIWYQPHAVALLRSLPEGAVSLAWSGGGRSDCAIGCQTAAPPTPLIHWPFTTGGITTPPPPTAPVLRRLARYSRFCQTDHQSPPRDGICGK